MQLPLRSMCVCALRLNEMNSNEIRVWMRMRECAERKPEEHDAFDSRSNSNKNNKDICNIKWRSGAPPAKQRQPHGTTTTTRVHRQPRRLHLFALPLPGSTTLAVEEHICAINIMTLVVACAYMYVWCECNRNAQRKWELCNDEICNECVRARMRSAIVRLCANGQWVGPTVRQWVGSIVNAIAQASENAIANALDVATECATHARVAHTCCCYVMRINKCNAVAIALIAEGKTTKIIIIKKGWITCFPYCSFYS